MQIGISIIGAFVSFILVIIVIFISKYVFCGFIFNCKNTSLGQFKCLVLILTLFKMLM